MSTIKIGSIAFIDAGFNRVAKVEMTISDPGVNITAALTIDLIEHNRDTGRINTLLEEDRVVEEARRKLHNVATALADQTKGWAGS